MSSIRAKIQSIFSDLDQRIDEINEERRFEGLPGATKVEIRLLGQMSLLANEKVSAELHLAQTADLDAFLQMEHFVKIEFKKLLMDAKLVYDEDSHLVWIPSSARFEEIFRYKNFSVLAIDPESALVSKAVKAPEKNKQLIREAIVSGLFPGLVDRIQENGGKLELFA